MNFTRGGHMAKYRDALPQLTGGMFLTDGGLETDLIFHEGFEMPLFASFPLLASEAGRTALRNYYLRCAQVATEAQVGFILEAATWRASRDWAVQLGYSSALLKDANRRAVELLVEIRTVLGDNTGPVVISAAIGPRGDAYNPDHLMTPEEAEDYHFEQIGTLADTAADLVTALTLTHAAEAIGIVRAAQRAHMPVVISFTVETDGVLPDGSPLSAAIHGVDGATDSGPVYYGINCAHPTHFNDVLVPKNHWSERIQMVRANASRMSHAELDDATDLDDGDPNEFGRECAELRERFPRINVLGGCCGTDVRHIQAIARACQ
jgi:S-methylmethionine-dependent homocysteine/selenocysteine methylase